MNFIINFLKNHKKLTIFLAILLFTTFYEIIPEIRGDKTNIITRLFYSHSELADKIKVKPYILTDEQVGELFLHPDKEPLLLKNGELDIAEGCINLVFRIEQRGPWIGGIIQYKINDNIEGKIEAMDLGAKRDGQPLYQNFVVPLGGRVISTGKKAEDYPKISYKWRELYGSW